MRQAALNQRKSITHINQKHDHATFLLPVNTFRIETIHIPSPHIITYVFRNFI